MKVVFVDVDGVLLPQPGEAAMRSGRWHGPDVTFDPTCMGCLSHLVACTGAKIVITSAWRRVTEEMDLLCWLALRRNLEQYGLQVYDTIPFIPYATRGEEIQAWLSASREPVERFCILEDREPLTPFESQSVMCDWRVGFAQKELTQALELLSGPQ